jgi:hypothetical protein
MRQPSNKQPQTTNHVMVGKRTQIKHSNHYDPLFNELECYICHNYGHKAAYCRLKNYKPDSNHRAEKVKVWKKNEYNKCGLVLSSQRKKDPRYIDNGCSSHMTGDKSKFLLLKETKLGSVTFGNDAPGKIKGKGLVSLSNGRIKTQDVLFVDGLKNNLLSFNQICDKGCEVTFTAKNCKIKTINTREMIAKGVKTKNNVYVLEEDKEKCHLTKFDESWLWHKRLGHLNFDHIFKLNNEGIVKDLPRISKPNNSICESCQMGEVDLCSIQIDKFHIFRETTSNCSYGSVRTIMKGSN